MTCKHGNNVEHTDTPELCCISCAEDIAYEEVLCFSCVYFAKDCGVAERWCSAHAMWVVGDNRQGAVNCSEYSRRS